MLRRHYICVDSTKREREAIWRIVRSRTTMVDASTRQRGEEMKEIQWDDRFKKMVLNLNGLPQACVDHKDSNDVVAELFRLLL